MIHAGYGQNVSTRKHTTQRNKNYSKKNVRFGLASYYADKFVGRSTATGEKYHHLKYTAACNVFPLNKKIKITNQKNHKWVIVRINDRLNRKNKRLVDVSKTVAKELGFVGAGIARVKVELLPK